MTIFFYQIFRSNQLQDVPRVQPQQHAQHLPPQSNRGPAPVRPPIRHPMALGQPLLQGTPRPPVSQPQGSPRLQAPQHVRPPPPPSYQPIAPAPTNPRARPVVQHQAQAIFIPQTAVVSSPSPMIAASRPSASLPAQVQQPQIQPRNRNAWWQSWLSSVLKNFSQDQLKFMQSQVNQWKNDLQEVTSQDELDSFDDLFNELWDDDDFLQHR